MKTFRRIFRRLRIALERQHRKFRPIRIPPGRKCRSSNDYCRIKDDVPASASTVDFIYSVPDAGCGD